MPKILLVLAVVVLFAVACGNQEPLPVSLANHEHEVSRLEQVRQLAITEEMERLSIRIEQVARVAVNGTPEARQLQKVSDYIKFQAFILAAQTTGDFDMAGEEIAKLLATNKLLSDVWSQVLAGQADPQFVDRLMLLDAWKALVQIISPPMGG